VHVTKTVKRLLKREAKKQKISVSRLVHTILVGALNALDGKDGR
jgi:hypothetical protein